MKMVLVEIHDLSPFNQERVPEAIAFLGEVGITKYSLLVIPNFQDKYSIHRHVRFVRTLESLGQEILLHGYTHKGKPNLTHILSTYNEGEFGGISLAETYQKIEIAIDLFESVGLKANVFVPPAWVANKWLEEVLNSFNFAGVAYMNFIKDLSKNHRIWAPALTFSSRSVISEVSLFIVPLLYSLYSKINIVRLCLHMSDFQNAKKIAFWEAILKKTKKERRFVYYNELLSKGRSSSSF